MPRILARRWALCLLLAGFTPSPPPASAAAPPEPRARLATYQSAAGERHFALSITVEGPPRDPRPHQVAILFDTSASQTGVFRDDALTALRQFLATLAEEDRVHLLALDLEAVPLTDAFVPPRGEAIEQGLKKLADRIPLGATDLPRGLAAAARSFPAAEAPRAILYLGDGLSRANIVDRQDFSETVEQLTRARAPLHGFAIGPERNTLLLAALAAQTGGMLYLDSAEAEEAQRAGVALAEVVHRPVYFPQETSWPASIHEAAPGRLPPLRSDRDVVIVGKLDPPGPLLLPLEITALGRRFPLRVEVAPEPSSDDFSFLPQVLELAAKEGEAALPLLGSAGLRELRRLLAESARQLVHLGEQALASDDLEGAQRLAEAARKRDPSSPQVETLLNAIRQARRQAKP